GFDGAPGAAEDVGEDVVERQLPEGDRLAGLEGGAGVVAERADGPDRGAGDVGEVQVGRSEVGRGDHGEVGDAKVGALIVEVTSVDGDWDGGEGECEVCAGAVSGGAGAGFFAAGGVAEAHIGV